MGSIDEMSRVLGSIETKINTLGADVAVIKDDMSAIAKDGCPRGKSNTHRINALEARRNKQAEPAHAEEANPVGFIEITKKSIRAYGTPSILVALLAIVAVYIWFVEPKRLKEVAREAVVEVSQK